MAITTKSDLRNYILQELGSPVINIEITEDQLNNQINKAIEMFVENHFEATIPVTFILETTDNTLKYILPEKIIAITDVLASNARDPLFSADYQVLKDIVLYRRGAQFDLTSWEITQNYIDLVNSYFGVKHDFTYNDITNEITFITQPKSSKVALIGYARIDNLQDETTESTVTNVFNHPWVKKYATELSRKQWSINIMKYSGIPLPGGGQLNWSEIQSLANENIEKLESELDLKYSAPIDIMMY